MRIVFMGTPDFAVPTLQMLIDHHELVGVVTQPDRAKGRGQTLTAPPVKQLATQQGIPVWQPEKIRQSILPQTLETVAPDVAVVVAYGQILPESILRIPRLGCINVHASLLPKYRGAAPINWAIMRGEQATGITTMLMDKGMDTGDMLLTRAIPIAPTDTAATLHDHLARLGADVLLETLAQLQAGTLQRIPQAHADATYAPMLKKEHGLIRWTDEAVTIDRQVRGLSPWPGAYTYWRGTMLKILQVALADCDPEMPPVPPGTLIDFDPQRGPRIATGQGCIRIQMIQPQAKKPMSGSDFCRGYRLAVGTRFEMQ